MKLAPGVRLNVGKRGLSVSAGVRGASITAGSRGVYGNVGLPGSGLSVRRKLSNGGASGSYGSSDGLGVTLSLKDDGSVSICDSEGNPLPQRIISILREQKGDWIKEWLQEQCDLWNRGIDQILNLHLATSPSKPIVFSPEPFTAPEPSKPVPKSTGFLGKVLRSHRERIMRENEEALRAYNSSHSSWKAERKTHETGQAVRKMFIEEARLSKPTAMQDFLEERIAQIEWPRETTVSFEVNETGTSVMLDVDLPEVEEIPTEQTTVAARGWKINTKTRSDTQRRKEYMTHVHAIVFRLIGESFAALPTVDQVVISGYSQRADKASGQIDDEYLLSVKVLRYEWSKLNFENLSSLDLPSCLESFDIRRKMTKTGQFSPIEPFSVAA